MNEANVFGRFVPDFGRVVAQMQYDMYHVYTVDEHTIFALGIVHRIETGALRDVAPVASEVIHRVLSRQVLYVATLLHDIAKERTATIRCWANEWPAGCVRASAWTRPRRKSPGWCAGIC